MEQYANAALAMMQKIIVAATPVAKLAWEISLLTLQIDAMAVLVIAMVSIICSAVCFFFLARMLKDVKAKAEKANVPLRVENLARKVIGHNPLREVHWTHFAFFDRVGLTSMWIMASLPAVGGAIQLLNVWLWVKLFRPELWLAHVAIEKLVK